MTEERTLTYRHTSTLQYFPFIRPSFIGSLFQGLEILGNFESYRANKRKETVKDKGWKLALL